MHQHMRLLTDLPRVPERRVHKSRANLAQQAHAGLDAVVPGDLDGDDSQVGGTSSQAPWLRGCDILWAWLLLWTS